LEVDQRIVETLETKIEATISEVLRKLDSKQLPPKPSRQTIHLMAKAATTVYEAAVENQPR
jgi:hypothetical protein